MLLLEHEPGSVAASADDSRRIRLRVRDGESGDRLFDLPYGKTTIGSSPRCNLRIQQPEVQPLHCLIVHEAEGLTVRRWAAESRLNGEPFQEAPLAPGDCLTVGPVQLEVEGIGTGSQPVAAAHTGFDSADAISECAEAIHHTTVWLNDDQRTPWLDDPGTVHEPQGAAEVELGSYGWSQAVDKMVVPFEAAKIVFRELQTATAISRGRSRKLLAALRQNRDEYRRLAERVEDLECLMQAALFEHESLKLFCEDSQTEGGVESTILKRSLDTLTPSGAMQAAAGPNRNDDENARLQSELEQLAAAQQQLALEKEALAHEIDALREQLAAVEQLRVDWEQAASRWQQEKAEWDGHRSEWVRQRETLQRELDESEARRADHVQRIDILEQELAALRQSLEGARQANRSAIESVSVGQTPDPCSSERAPVHEFNWALAANRQTDHAERADSTTDKSGIGESEWGRTDWEIEQPPAAPVEPDFQMEDDASSPSGQPESGAAESSSWKQAAATPDLVSEASAPAESPASMEQQPAWHGEDSVESAPEEAQPTSFIERYAHMFGDDKSVAPQSQADVATRSQDDEAGLRKQRSMEIVQRDGASQSPSNEADEESIEQYMAKLLQRVRGDGPRVEASQALPTAAVSAPLKQAVARGDLTSESLAAVDLGAWRPTVSATPAVAGDDEQITTSLGTTRRKSPLVEQSADLEAFRALANESARRAISTHALRKHQRNAVTKVIVSTLAGMTSLWMMLEAPDWRDLQFITACVSLLVAAYWAGETFRTFLESLRAAAYDGPEDELADFIEALRPQLPIDVEKT